MAFYYMDYPAYFNCQYFTYLQTFDTTQFYQDNNPTQPIIKEEFLKVPLIKIEDNVKIENTIVDSKLVNQMEVKNNATNQIPKPVKSIEKKSKKIKLSKTPIHQNPFRNIHTNIGNQIITFLYIEKKSLQTIKICFPEISRSDLNNYYQYATNIKKSINGYINREKLKNIWHKKDVKPNQIYYHQMLRTLSYYYLTHHAIMSILTSKKMSKETLNQHMRIRRNLVKLLINEQTVDL